jgi:aryl-alcohol dehydrogenase-like predicted oxidoreductase
MAFGILSGKFLTGENILTQELTYFLNLQDTIAPSAPKRQSYIRKLRKKMVNFNRVVSGIYRTTIFVTSTIIEATTMEQLKENIDSIKVSLSDEILKAIDEVQAIIPDPAP